jgi:hypothetical protein
MSSESPSAPQNAPPPKPFDQAVGEVYRDLQEIIQKRETLDRSVKETVTKELGDLA